MRDRFLTQSFSYKLKKIKRKFVTHQMYDRTITITLMQRSIRYSFVSDFLSLTYSGELLAFIVPVLNTEIFTSFYFHAGRLYFK